MVYVQTLLNHTPQNPVAAAAVLLALYAFKSATVFFPLILLEIVTGHLFSPGTALLINFVGVIITLTVPYWIGRWAGMNTSQKWIDKYPKFGVILATLMGENIQNPDSPMFWISAGLTVLLYYLYRRRLHGKEAEEK